MVNQEELILDTLYALTQDEQERDLADSELYGYLAMYDYCVTNGIAIDFEVII